MNVHHLERASLFLSTLYGTTVILACFFGHLAFIGDVSSKMNLPGFAEDLTGAYSSELTEELLFVFPVLALVSSPSRSIKQAASDLLFILGKIATNLMIAPKEKQVVEGNHLSISTPGHIIFRFLRNMWFQV